ncbi:MAG: type domain, partial [Abditibacteriota bacterium]|nr:type domain [Abditibacteriota bacterium]
MQHVSYLMLCAAIGSAANGAMAQTAAPSAVPKPTAQVTTQAAPQSVAPPQSLIGRGGAGLQRMLLSALDTDSDIQKAGWKLGDLAIEAAPAGIKPKFGRRALTLRGRAEGAGAKGDFAVAGAIPGNGRAIGMWAHLGAASNVESVGFQLQDTESEVLMYHVPANWTGWKWVETDLNSSPLVQAYPQTGKDSKVTGSISSVHVVWFAKAAGPSAITVNALMAAAQFAQMPALSLQAQIGGADWDEPGRPLASQIVLTNFLDKETAAQLEYSIQRVPTLFLNPVPDPIYGSDHALGAKSWTEVAGKRVEEGSLTDGKEWTNVRPSLGPDKGTEAFQYIDLGRERRITHLTYLAGDANWAWKVDLSASPDGQNYQPVKELQGVDMQKKWGFQALPVTQPFTARYLRLRHHKNGEKVTDFAMPSAFSVYDGAADENWGLPTAGEVVAQGKVSPRIAAHDIASVPIASVRPLATGAYLVAVRLQAAGRTQLLTDHFLVLPQPMKAVSASSRFGLNSAATTWTPSHQRLGIGWVRFENLKWPMLSPEPNVYRYDGSVAPWHVNADQ